MHFFDTNILVYAHSQDPRNAVARALLRQEGVISVQCLNEFVNVARRKLCMTWDEVQESLDFIHTCCPTILALSVPLHEHACHIAARFRLSIYDSLIVAAAFEAKCDILYSEDMQDGLVMEGPDGHLLRIVNPFKDLA